MPKLAPQPVPEAPRSMYEQGLSGRSGKEKLFAPLGRNMWQGHTNVLYCFPNHIGVSVWSEQPFFLYQPHISGTYRIHAASGLSLRAALLNIGAS